MLLKLVIGDGEWKSGNECTEVTCPRIQNDRQRKRKGSKKSRNNLAWRPKRRETIWVNVRKYCGCKCVFLPAVPPDDQYSLVHVRAESDWHWDKQSMNGAQVENWVLLRWLNTVFMCTFADTIQCAHGDFKNQHAINSAIIVFTQHPHYLCHFSL